MGYLRFFARLIQIRMQGAVEYRGAFLLAFAAKAAMFTTDLILLWLLIRLFEGMAGWGQYEVMFLYSLNLASWAFAGFFLFVPFNTLSRKIATGEFDDVLTKPLNPFLYLISKDATIDYVSNLTVAFSALFLCIYKLNITLDLPGGLMLVAFLFGATLIQGALFIIPNVPAFWIVQNSSIRQLFQGDLNQFIRYPISAYNKLIQILMTVVFPYAFINFFPAQYMLGKREETMFPGFFQFMTPVVGIFLIVIAYRYWLYGLKHYTSTGS